MTSIVIIRSLTPVEYGNYQFLLSIFVAVFTFANLNTQNGYFTFASQKKESYSFYKNYFVWEFIQLFAMLFFVIVVYIFEIYNLFLGLDFFLVILALVAVFFTKNIRELITNTFESQRMTSYYLKFTFAINMIHFTIIGSLAYFYTIDISTVLILTVVEFTIYLAISIYIFIINKSKFINTGIKYALKDSLSRYVIYIKPLFFSSLLSFIYIFLERWLLQKYAGAEQQAYLSLAIQFSTIVLILTTSILKIFWKEVAEHINDKNSDKLKLLFDTATKNIFLITTIISMFFILNSKDIITIVYSEKYIAGVYVFMLINFYTIHQTLGQLYGTFLLALEETKVYSILVICVTLVSIPLVYLVLVPNELVAISLGATGVGIIMVVVQFVFINIMGFYIQKKFQFNSIFLNQIKYILGFLVLLFCIQFMSQKLIDNVLLQLIVQGFGVLMVLVIIYLEKIKQYLNQKGVL
jgi:O-antigen/teichoic acid export membrane protein